MPLIYLVTKLEQGLTLSEAFATINRGQPWRWISLVLSSSQSCVRIKGDRGKPRVLEERGESNSLVRKRERESRREEDAAWVVGERERSAVAREGLLVFRGLLFSANC